MVAAPAGASPARRRTIGADGAACTATRDHARQRAEAGRLREAEDLYLACARVACGEVIRQDCLARHTQLGGDIPSIVPLVTDQAGAPRVLVEMRVDGQLVMSRLSGQAVPLDPGKHEVSFSTDDGVVATRQVFVAQGERNRALHVVLHAGEPAAAAAKVAPIERLERVAKVDKKRDEGDDGEGEPSPVPAAAAPRPQLVDARPTATVERRPAGERPSSAGAYVFGALGLAGVGGFALLTSWGRADNRMLASCSPTCPAASARHVRQLYWAADASLGVGLVSLGLATWLFSGRF